MKYDSETVGDGAEKHEHDFKIQFQCLVQVTITSLIQVGTVLGVLFLMMPDVGDPTSTSRVVTVVLVQMCLSDQF